MLIDCLISKKDYLISKHAKKDGLEIFRSILISQVDLIFFFQMLLYLTRRASPLIAYAFLRLIISLSLLLYKKSLCPLDQKEKKNLDNLKVNPHYSRVDLLRNQITAKSCTYSYFGPRNSWLLLWAKYSVST